MPYPKVRIPRGQASLGILKMRGGDWRCRLHYNGRGIMPGMAQVAALAQTQCYRVESARPEPFGRLHGFIGLEAVSFS